jgi:hypothetical protein
MFSSIPALSQVFSSEGGNTIVHMEKHSLEAGTDLIS